jgi:ABC-type phosphate/phosphonate transport system substrate-binding protein
LNLVTSSRMYDAGPKAAAAWRALFDRAFADLGVEVERIEHRHPLPIESLWEEPGLFGAFMCGWPFVRTGPRMQAIAAPVPSPARYESKPRYCSDFLVREDSGWTRVEDAFGHRFGWTVAGSHSGFNAPRAFFSGLVSPQRSRLFREAAGPLGSPASALDALKSGRVDLVALDGFWLDLVRHHEPARLEGVRAVGHTPWAPIPLLVAAPSVDAVLSRRLRERLVSLHEAPGYRALLSEVLLERFAVPDVGSYGALERLASDAGRAGYAIIA